MATTTERSRPRFAKAEATRRALITAGRDLFGTQGYAGTSVDEVVNAAGVTKGALYHHFRDKDDLFRAVVEEVKGEVTAVAGESFLDTSVDGDPLRRLHVLCLALIDANLDPAVQRISLVDARSVLDAPTRRNLDARYEVSLLRGAFRGAMRTGAVDRQPLAPLAHIVAGAVFEACALVAEAEDTDTARSEAIEILSRLLDGLRPRA
jgi:AcrR family transcriptional regulator